VSRGETVLARRATANLIGALKSFLKGSEIKRLERLPVIARTRGFDPTRCAPIGSPLRLVSQTRGVGMACACVKAGKQKCGPCKDAEASHMKPLDHGCQWGKCS
jgi:hypothetical protein